MFVIFWFVNGGREVNAVIDAVGPAKGKVSVTGESSLLHY